MAPAPIAVVSDNGPCFSRRGVQDRVRRTRSAAATRPHPGAITPDQRRHRKVVRHLKYEHLFRGVITDGDALDMEVHRFRIIYNTIRPHQALDDRTPSTAYTGCDQLKTAR
jgi:putative transposase